MFSTSSSAPTLAEIFWPADENKVLRAIFLAIIGSALLTLSAKVQVPFWPVPMTMQTLVVLVVGAALGARLAGATVLLYLGQGAIGLPVFAQGGGVAYLLGPTGGYLVGFFFAAIVVGWLAERGWDRHIASTAVAMALGQAVIFAFGLGWLGSVIGFDKVIAVGLTPFLAAGALKLALGVAILPLAWRLVGKRQHHKS
ncbi:MAG: biotin transporter BioY [Alphaproteobacteria bacterium]